MSKSNKVRKQCQAFVSSTKKQCEKFALRGSRYCWHHQSKLPILITLLVGAITGLLIPKIWDAILPPKVLQEIESNTERIPNMAQDINNVVNTIQSVEDIREEIDITYLVNYKTARLVKHRATDSTVFQDIIYAVLEFGTLLNSDPNLAQDFQNVINIRNNVPLVNPMFIIDLFKDFTEFLIVANMAKHISGADTEKYFYRGEHWRGFGWPHEIIRDDFKDVNCIEGINESSALFNLKRPTIPRKLKLRLPNNTSVRFVNEIPEWGSKYVIENDYVTIEISCHISSSSINNMMGFIKNQYLYPNDRGKLPVTAFRMISGMVYYEAKFNESRYGFPEMIHYENWAKDLLALQKRKFKWCSPPLLDDQDVIMFLESINTPGN